MSRHVFLLLLAVALAWPLGPARAAEPAAPTTVTAAVEPRETTQGESVLLRVLVTGEAPATVDVSGIEDFTVIPRGQAVGTRPAGAATQLVTVFRFELSPRRTGLLRVPPLIVSSGGTVTRTPPLTVPVRPRQTPPKTLGGQDLVLDATVSTDAPFVGEPFVYTLRLFRSRAVESVRLTPPDFAGFTVQALPGQRNDELSANGRHYAVSAVDYRLTPTRAGRVTLGTATATCQETVDPNRSHGSRTRQESGPALTVSVRPLPPFPGPGSFSGLVGHVGLKARLAPPEPGQGSGPVLEATITGQGNLAAMAPPVPILPPGLTAVVLPPLETDRPDGVQETRTFRYALSLSPPDSLARPEVRLTVFDPAKAAYVTLRATPEALPRATPGAPPFPDLPPDALASAAPPSPAVIGLGAVLGPLGFLWIRLRQRRRHRPGPPASAGPTDLAEALRQALAEARPTPETAAARQTLDRLDRLLYSGQAVADADLTATARQARRALRELSR